MDNSQMLQFSPLLLSPECDKETKGMECIWYVNSQQLVKHATAINIRIVSACQHYYDK